MKITPITNNNIQNKNVSTKGFVGPNTTSMLNNMSATLTKAAEDEIPQRKNTALLLAKEVDTLLNDMKKIMLNFGKTCVLDYIPSDINPEDKLFVITSEDSDYAKSLGIVNVSDKYYRHDMTNLTKFIKEKLLKVDPDETNFRFRIMERRNIPDSVRDSFAPEQRTWFINKEFGHLYNDNGYPWYEDSKDARNVFEIARIIVQEEKKGKGN